jgi:hypothetical protein
MSSVIENAVKFVAKILFQKAATVCLDNKIEYQKTKDTLTDKIDRIENSLKLLQTRDLMASLEYFKIALTAIKSKEYICDNVKKDLENSRKLAILAYDTVSSINDKLTTTKIVIATSILLFSEDEVLLSVNVSSALERLLKNKTIQETAANECRENFTFWKTYRKEFIAKLRNLINTVYEYQINIKSKYDIIDYEKDKKMNKIFSLVPIEFNKFSTNFLFWDDLTLSDEKTITSICVENGKNLLIGTANDMRRYEYNTDEGKWICNLHFNKKITTVHRIMQLSNGDIFACIGISACVISKDSVVSNFKINSGYEQAFAMSFFTVGDVLPLTNGKFINVHETNKTIITVDKDDPKSTSVEKLGYLGYYYSGVTCGCTLNDGTLIVTSSYDRNMTRGHHIHYGYLLLLEKRTGSESESKYVTPSWNKSDDWIVKEKISFGGFALGVYTLDNGHLLAITSYNLIVVYPEDEPNEPLNGSDKQKWAHKKIASIGGNYHNKVKTKVRIYKGLILLGDCDHFKIIQRSEIDPTEYTVHEIYGTKNEIIDIDLFDDKRICTLDTKGKIKMWKPHGITKEAMG